GGRTDCFDRFGLGTVAPLPPANAQPRTHGKSGQFLFETFARREPLAFRLPEFRRQSSPSLRQFPRSLARKAGRSTSRVDQGPIDRGNLALQALHQLFLVANGVANLFGLAA